MRNRSGKWDALAACVVLFGSVAVVRAQATKTGTPAPAEEWRSYSYADDGFLAAYPSEPAVQKKNVDTAAGAFELRTYVAQPVDAVLLVSVCDYGANAPHTDAAARLEGAKNGALAISGSRLAGEKKISLAGYPGLEFEAESMTVHFTARLYVVDTRLYEVLVIYPLARPYAQAARFLDSFQFIALSPSAETGK